MKFEKTEVFNFEGAIRGMRNPLESWDKSDSHKIILDYIDESEEMLIYSKGGNFFVGKKDLELMQKLIKAGSEHRKFMRQIFVSVDITAPLYWWKEFDTYKVGTVANSTSTMHKLASTPITMDCFEMGNFESDLDADDEETPLILKDYWENNVIWSLEYLRQKYNETKDKRYWKELIRLLPESWLQTRTITMNYENILTMIKQRKSHKLTEWSVYFIAWCRCLPYAEELLFLRENKNDN